MKTKDKTMLGVVGGLILLFAVTAPTTATINSPVKPVTTTNPTPAPTESTNPEKPTPPGHYGGMYGNSLGY